jgi:hypothetical protein
MVKKVRGHGAGVPDPAEGRRRHDREAKALARLDSLEWCPQLGPYRAVGFDFGVRVMDPALRGYLDKALETLGRGSKSRRRPAHVYSVVDAGPQARQRFSLYFDGLRIVRSPAPSLALSYLLWHVNRSVVRTGDDYLLIHASAAALDGRSVLMPAPMESGKTTLCSGLLRRGLQYVTDEAVAIDPKDGRIHPYPKPLSVDAGSWGVLADLKPDLSEEATTYLMGQWHVSPTSIRPDAVAGVTRARLVVSPRYRAGEKTKLEEISRAEAVLMLADNSFNFGLHGGDGLRALADVVRGCTCYRLTMNDLDEACDEVISLLERTR